FGWPPMTASKMSMHAPRKLVSCKVARSGCGSSPTWRTNATRSSRRPRAASRIQYGLTLSQRRFLSWRSATRTASWTAPSTHSSRSGQRVTPTDLPFEEIWLHDFEFVSQPGERPDVVCLAAHELRSRRTLRLWRDALGDQPPYRTDKDVLFVSFVANAECACHLSLRWPLPANVLDLSPVFRNLTNGRSTPEGKGLLGALRYFGLDTISIKHKEAMQKRVMRGWPFTPEEREQILK